MKKQNMEFGVLFWIHSILTLLYILTPFLISWKIVISIVILLQLQFFFIGGCWLSHLELGKSDDNIFIYHYLRKLLPRIKFKQIKILGMYIVPIIIIATALFLQLKLGYKPLL